jgi:hypothetical protein
MNEVNAACAAGIRYDLDSYLARSKAFDRAVASQDITLIEKWLAETQETVDTRPEGFPFSSVARNFVEEARSNFERDTGVRLRPRAATFPVISSVIVAICLVHCVLWLATPLFPYIGIVSPFALLYPAISEEGNSPALVAVVALEHAALTGFAALVVWRFSRFIWASYYDGRYYHLANGRELQPSQPRKVVKYRIAGRVALAGALYLALVEPAAMFGVLLIALTASAYYCFRRATNAETPDGRLLLASDPRKPIAFLRSFSEEDTFLVRDEYRVRVYQVIEDIAARQLSLVGPFVAIGNPRGKHPVGAAARMTFSEGEWQSEIAKICAGSRLIIMVAGLTDSLIWELRMIVDQHCLNRLLLLFPEDPEDTIRMKLRRVREAFAGVPWFSRLYHLDPRNLIAIYFSGDGIIAMHARHKSASAYQLTWQLALRNSRVGLSCPA